ncbi:hypothetical protein CONPUDRAFT_90987 [Coniophora puteana RWD-64-598 SS2]|uniref:Methyltransferase n=1 Tax=Coniophora puteana (strain RWD-64-598) TaxID=741705 RepID=A0A5M3MK91_CONPW|nr:uncharacterized protein CONPUDRAFT_90987 [Coniophora puteana RWD-64-598 SS2]EIW79648.1 hypothetical protein CONPUDRAFT_90987 [Coniophora puteana RWD-64-598 SS2]
MTDRAWSHGDDNKAPYRYASEPPEGVPTTNVAEEPHKVIIRDVRARPDATGLDKTGFEFLLYPSKEANFDNEERVKKEYYAEVEDILKKRTGAHRVFIFDHTIRVHIDQTTEAAVQRVRDHMGDEAEQLLKGRFCIINVWRPIENTVAHSPLALADYRSIDKERDLVATRLLYPNKVGGTFDVRFNPSHEWKYLADQTIDEVTLIKCFDSDASKARMTPHTAFWDPTSPADAPERQSIEVRALVFINDKNESLRAAL